MISKEEIQRIYKEKGYTTTQVANILNISRRSLYNLLEGKMSQEKSHNYIKLIVHLKPLYNTNFINQPAGLSKEFVEKKRKTINIKIDDTFKNIDKFILDKDVEELKREDELMCKLVDIKTVGGRLLGEQLGTKDMYSIYNIFKQELTDKKELETYYNKNKDFKVKYNELNSKLNAIEEAIKNNPYINTLGMELLINKIKQIIGGNK